MIILIGGSSHVGKTFLAQKMMEALKIPCKAQPDMLPSWKTEKEKNCRHEGSIIICQKTNIVLN